MPRADYLHAAVATALLWGAHGHALALPPVVPQVNPGGKATPSRKSESARPAPGPVDSAPPSSKAKGPKAPAEKLIQKAPASRRMGPQVITGTLFLYSRTLVFEPKDQTQTQMRLPLKDIAEIELEDAPWGGEAIRIRAQEGSTSLDAFGTPLLGVANAQAWRGAILEQGYNSGTQALRPKLPGKAVVLGDAAFALPESWVVFAANEVVANTQDASVQLWAWSKPGTNAAGLDKLMRDGPPVLGWSATLDGAITKKDLGKGARLAEYEATSLFGAKSRFIHLTVLTPSNKTLVVAIRFDATAEANARRVTDDLMKSLAFGG